MGTRSLTVFEDERGDEIAVLYRQYDGYPQGHGLELAGFLAGINLTDGIGGGMAVGKFANGMNCLAAQVVAKFKIDIGGFYLYPAGTRDAGEEYIYRVTGKGNFRNPGTVELTIIEVGCNGPDKILFSGTAAEALAFCKAS